MDDEQDGSENESLRSLNSDIPTHVNFINRTEQSARIWWLDFTGQPVSYGDIRPSGSLPMDTFLTHPWVFRACLTGANLQGNMEDVYMPALTEYGEDGHPEYLDVIITSPVYSLQEYCLMLIRQSVKEEDYGRLDIPESLRRDLSRPRDLLQELQLLNSAGI